MHAPPHAARSYRRARRSFSAKLALALALTVAAPSAVLTAPREAAACGGCFAPPGAIQTVNSHRMVLSLSRTRTILWDQFSYSGRPADFSWILPLQNGPSARIAVADDRFMTLLDNTTTPVLNAPSAPFCFGCFGPPAEAGTFGDASAASDSGAVVYRQEVVGPYDVAVIGGTDPMAIRTWLRDNGFSVPPAISPVIDYYTSTHSDYIALRLRPGEGINRMVPVRVTMTGYVPVLPLRMIAAGIADKVGLSLTVFADARIEAMNFPNGEISNADLAYDFASPTSPATDFLNAFNAINRANGNRVWLAESVSNQSSTALISQAERFVRVMSTPEDCFGGSPFFDAGIPEASTDGGDSGCRASNAVDDMREAFEGIGPNATVTRLRADLAGAMLDRDLTLQASTRGMRDRFYTYGTVRNTPVCPPVDCGVGPGFPETGPGTDATIREEAGTMEPFDGGAPEAGPRDGGVAMDGPVVDATLARDGGVGGDVGAEIPDVRAAGGGCSVDAPPGSVRSITGLAGLCAAAAGFALRRGRKSRR